MATNKLVTVEQLDRAVDGFAAEVKAANFEQKVNLKALAYEDEVSSAIVSSSLTTILAAKMDASDAQNLVAGEVGMTYKPGGAYAFANLPAPSASNYGVVYHVTDEFTTDNRFEEGAGKTFSSGSEVGVVGKTGTIRWGELPRSVDLNDGIERGDRVDLDQTAQTVSDPSTLNEGEVASIVFVQQDGWDQAAVPKTSRDALISVLASNYAIVLADGVWLKNLRYAYRDNEKVTDNGDGTSTTTPATKWAFFITGEITKTEPTPVYLYNVFSGFIDTTKFASQSSFTTFKAALDELEVATTSDIQALIDGLSLEDTVTPTKAAGVYDANGNLLKSWNQLIADGDVVVSDGKMQASGVHQKLDSNAREFVISDSVTSIGDDVFIGSGTSDDKLASIIIPNSVTSIRSLSFAYNSKLASINIPDSVTSIGEGAFEGCNSLTSVTLSNNLVNIAGNAFVYCANLATIYYNGTLTDEQVKAGSNATVVRS